MRAAPMAQAIYCCCVQAARQRSMASREMASAAAGAALTNAIAPSGSTLH